MTIKSCIKLLKKANTSTEEIDIMLSTQLKLNVNMSGRNAEHLGASVASALKPDDGKAFYANICEPEDYKGRYYICKDPCQFIGLDKCNPLNWKLVYCRKVCDKFGKAGVCRRALIKVEYLS